MEQMIQLVIFDIDGTIVDAYGAIAKSLNYTLKRYHHPPIGERRVSRSVGHGDRNFVHQYFPSAEADQALEIYRAHHAKALLKYSRPTRGAKKLLKRLKTDGLLLAVASNRPAQFSKILLDHLELSGYFDMVVCARTKRDMKPSGVLISRILKRLKVKKRNAVYVGDMVTDILAGRRAGIATVAVRGGSSYRRELEEAKPSVIIKDLTQFSSALSRI